MVADEDRPDGSLMQLVESRIKQFRKKGSLEDSFRVTVVTNQLIDWINTRAVPNPIKTVIEKLLLLETFNRKRWVEHFQTREESVKPSPLSFQLLMDFKPEKQEQLLSYMCSNTFVEIQNSLDQYSRQQLYTLIEYLVIQNVVMYNEVGQLNWST